MIDTLTKPTRESRQQADFWAIRTRSVHQLKLDDNLSNLVDDLVKRLIYNEIDVGQMAVDLTIALGEDMSPLVLAAQNDFSRLVDKYIEAHMWNEPNDVKPSLRFLMFRAILCEHILHKLGKDNELVETWTCPECGRRMVDLRVTSQPHVLISRALNSQITHLHGCGHLPGTDLYLLDPPSFISLSVPDNIPLYRLPSSGRYFRFVRFSQNVCVVSEEKLLEGK